MVLHKIKWNGGGSVWFAKEIKSFSAILWVWFIANDNWLFLSILLAAWSVSFSPYVFRTIVYTNLVKMDT